MQSLSDFMIDLWQSDTGKLALLAGGSLIALFSICAVCVAGSLLFQWVEGRNRPLPQEPARPVEAAAPSTPTPGATVLSALPTARSEPVSTSTPVFPTPTGTRVVLPTEPSTPPPTPTNTPVVSPTPASEPVPDASEFQEAFVIHVVDGDTIDVVIGRTEYRVHYLLVDAPETKHPSRGIEPLGPEAAAFNEALVLAQNVLLEKDVTDTDEHGRLLRYVWLGDRLINEELLRKGLARMAAFPPNAKYADHFLAVQRAAQAAGAGMWAPGVEGVQTPVPVGTPVQEPPAGG